MGREVRMVPANWQHPRAEDGRYVPLLGTSFARAAAEWDEGSAKWSAGMIRCWGGLADWEPIPPECSESSFVDYAGERPVESDYMPDWPESERTHFQMYEDTSEGTPISPVMPDAESLARWLADSGASAFAGMTATYDQWLATIRRGWAPSAVIGDGAIASGVAAMGKEEV